MDWSLWFFSLLLANRMWLKRFLAIIVIICPVFFWSCLSGIDPLPSSVKDLSISLSLPIGKSDVKVANTYNPGPQNYWLLSFVPEWAKYEEIYYTDTIAVDLSKIYEKVPSDKQPSDIIKYLAFKINVWNEFQASAIADLRFVDQSYNSIYVFNPVKIPKGTVVFKLQNSEVNVINPGFSSQIIDFNSNQIDSLNDAQYLVVHFVIDLKDANPYTFILWDNLKMNCQLGARVDFILTDI